MDNELELIKSRYARRGIKKNQYNILKPSVYLTIQERERALLCLFSKKFSNIHEKKVLEIGCGSGDNLLQLIRLGFSPENLIGNELLEERVNAARRCLPNTVQIVAGDACALCFPSESFDVVYQSVVFSSILDNAFQERLATRMWDMVKPGGGIIWYDFIYNNPANPDVRGVTLQRVRKLFPEGKISYSRVTLAPPLSRWITRIHPNGYHLLNVFPFLRTHILAWIEK